MRLTTVGEPVSRALARMTRTRLDDDSERIFMVLMYVIPWEFNSGRAAARVTRALRVFYIV